MNLEINYEPDTEEIKMVYENAMLIVATRKGDGKITYSKNMDKVEEEVQPVLMRICTMLMEIE